MSVFKRKKNRNLTKSPGHKSAFKAYLSEASKKRSATSPRINARDENIRIEITKRVFIAFADKSSLLKDFGKDFPFRWIYITIDGARLSSDFRRRNNFSAINRTEFPQTKKTRNLCRTGINSAFLRFIIFYRQALRHYPLRSVPDESYVLREKHGRVVKHSQRTRFYYERGNVVPLGGLRRERALNANVRGRIL